MSFPPAPPIPPAFTTAGEPPLWAPYYNASIGIAWSRFWRKYATFSGRASRSEFWWFELIYFIFGVVLEIVVFSVGFAGTTVDPTTGAIAFGPGYWIVSAILWIVSLGVLVPTLALAWRRLHDTNRSGAYYFIGFIPIVGGIILIVLFASASDPAGARFDQPQA
jgi:uncharacterized membrane protein YhaH (DUF805 family)